MKHTIRGQHKPKITSLHASTRRIQLEILTNSLNWTLPIPQHSAADTNRLLSMKYVYNYEHLNNILKINNVIRETSRTNLRPIVKVHLWHACQRFRNNKHRFEPGNIRKKRIIIKRTRCPRTSCRKQVQMHKCEEEIT